MIMILSVQNFVFTKNASLESLTMDDFVMVFLHNSTTIQLSSEREVEAENYLRIDCYVMYNGNP